MTGFATCQACAGSLKARLRHSCGERRNPAGCCVQCQSFACGLHGQREISSQQFRCVECLPTLLLYSAVFYSGSENELAKAIIERQPVWGPLRSGRQVESDLLFVEQHDLVCEETGGSFSEFYEHSGFDLELPEMRPASSEKILRDLKRIEFRLDSTLHGNLLKLTAAYLAFLYPEQNANRVLPQEMQVLRSAWFPISKERNAEKLSVVFAQGPMIGALKTKLKEETC